MMMEGKDGGGRGEGSGHRSLSQLTRPCGAAVSLSLSAPPSDTPTPPPPRTSPGLTHSSLCGDRRRGISWRIVRGSSFHRSCEETRGGRRWWWWGGVVTAVAPLKSGFLILEMSCERLIKEETFSWTNDFAAVAVQR